MLDFLIISTRTAKRGRQEYVEVYPNFRLYPKSSDLMIRGGDFYAVWIEDRGLWSTNEHELLQLIDHELDKYVRENQDKFGDLEVRVLHMWDSQSGMIDAWHKYCQKQMRDSFVMLDEKLIFSNTETNKTDYASKRLPYPLEKGDTPGFDTLMSTLYSEEERKKIEWAIGAIVSGDSKDIQKFLVLYGAAGTGKSTILNIIQKLFEGYYAVFDAKALGNANNSFALEAFKTNPLVAIQHDGDLSKIEDNTRLNSLVSHEVMTVNEKFKATYANSFKCFLIMGTNSPVKITDGKSGLLRRLIDVSPSGKKLGIREYKKAVKQVDFELGAIAQHCLEVYQNDPGAYDDYVPITMLGASNDFYNYVINSYHVFKKEDGTTLRAAWEMYKTYCEEAKVPYALSRMKFKEELKNYFWNYQERVVEADGTRLNSYYSDFRTDIFEQDEKKPEGENGGDNSHSRINFRELDSDSRSIFDAERRSCLAQYASDKGTPINYWSEVTSTLSDLDTSRLHYVKVPENHIVIDFDIKDENGNKSMEKNLEAASKWPPTYAELSKSGAGIHLHYIYTGDVSKLSRIYDDDIEVKVFTGNSSLRRKLTKCNNIPIATISSGLPLKGEDKVINFDGVMNEKTIRAQIKKNLNKEYHAATKPSVDFIYKILEDAYSSGVAYDVSDMKNAVFAFAANSTNQSDICIKMVGKMKFKSEEESVGESGSDDIPIVFYDVEVFPNLFLVNWKVQGKGKPVVRMINPKPSDIEELMHFRLVGFNCRRYDNHMIYACLMGYSNEKLYELSQKIISGDRKAFFGEAYNVSYTDVYDFAATKQSLKKWEIELGIHHQELGLPWDQPVPEDQWLKVAEYCDNDVIATEAVFDACKGDFVAREVLAKLAGMTVNDTTNSLTTRIIFGSERKPQLEYTHLEETFPGYEFVFDEDNKPHNMYRGVDLGFGGYVYAEPGMYGNVALLDIASLHPHSIIAMNCFGKYTQRFKDILDARMFIKHGDFDSARKMLDGRLAEFLKDESNAKELSQALKIAINSVYGLTSASFDNPFRDIRNKNNIVALRGALFMKTLQDEVQARGFKVIHIKTDSIKIADATPDIIQFCMDFAKEYGYTFEHEATYDRMCLVNNAVYIAKYKDGKHSGEWTATGAQFKVPYVFKKLFSKEPIEFEDLCETKEVKTALYLDMNENLGDGDHEYVFVGKVGLFCPIIPGHNGGILLRQATDKDGNIKYDSATGADGYRWLEAEAVKLLEKEDYIDYSYFDNMINSAIYGSGSGKARKPGISDFGDFEWFVSDDPYISPWEAADSPWDDEPNLFAVR